MARVRFISFGKRVWNCGVAFLFAALVAYAILATTPFRIRADANYLQKRPAFRPRQASPFYKNRHPYNCPAIVEGDWSTILKASAGGMVLETDFMVWTNFSSCKTIKQRLFYAEEPGSSEEAAFPLAYAILVNQDLVQTELLLNAIYAPQNAYCLHVDLKASQLYENGLRRLAKCFPNIFITEEKYAVSSLGLNMIRAFRSCFKLLLERSGSWKYAFTLQGQDFPLRTNKELVKIAKILNGSNDVELLPSMDHLLTKRYRYTYDKNGVPTDINSAEVSDGPTPKPIDGLKLYKGSVSATMSRAFVDYIMASTKAAQLVEFLDNTIRTDEFYWATLNHNFEELAVPGGYPGRCVAIGRKDWLTRFTEWSDYPNATCNGAWRHSVCMFGMADLKQLSQRPELFANKLSVQVEAVAAHCMHELHFNRTFFEEEYPSKDYGFNKTWYEHSAGVAFQKLIRDNPQAAATNFTCIPCTSNCLH